MTEKTQYKLLSVHRKDVDVNNIGDYIQALAASQFLPQVDGFINREQLKSYNEGPCKVIMNGWYMHDPSQWPPSNAIDPLFVAFHLNLSAKDGLLREDGVRYLKDHQPIGCRDKYTVNLLTSKGIEAYFSGCLTLTLGQKYKSEEKEGKCYVVDPKIPSSKALKDIIKDIIFIIRNYSLVKSVTKKMYSKASLKNQRMAARFLRTYSEYVDLQTLAESEYIHQQDSKYTKDFEKDDDRLREAERLVKLYAKARMVITSRIHCALPCLGLGTPVVFVHKENTDEISRCRFDGILELFNSFVCYNNRIEPSFQISQKLSTNNPSKNKNGWKSLADDLINKCRGFVNKNE